MEKETFVVGIAGRAGSGKDTFADLFCNLIEGRSFIKVAFADPIKEMLAVIGVDDVDKYKLKKHPILGVTSRVMMQTLGTEWGRDTIYENIWVDIAKQKGLGKDILVISDVRFQNEADFVRDNGILIHIVNRGGIDSQHYSESGIEAIGVDIVVDNSSDIKSLEQSVRMVSDVLELVYDC